MKMTENNEYKSNIISPISPEVEEVKDNYNSLRSDFIKKNKVEITDEDITVFRKPRSGCNKCYGTGVEGVWASTSLFNPGELKLCRCITNMFGKVFPDVTKEADTNKYLSFGAFRKMMKSARKRYNIKEPEDEQVTKMDVVPNKGNVEETSAGQDEREPAGDNREAVGQDSPS
jgi:hypothetical protein